MAEVGEAPGLVGLGHDIADEAIRLVHAEIALLKARAVAAALRLGLGLGLLAMAVLLLVAGASFTLATMVEGLHPMDSWPLYGSVVALLAAALCLGLAGKSPSAISSVATGLAGLCAVAWLGLLIWFYVVAIIGSGDELGRRGWAIAASVLSGGGLLSGGVGGILVWRALQQLGGTKENLMEDAAWARRLTKRSNSES